LPTNLTPVCGGHPARACQEGPDEFDISSHFVNILKLGNWHRKRPQVSETAPRRPKKLRPKDRILPGPIFKIFSQKMQKLALSTQNKAKLFKFLIITLVFEKKNANFFAESWQKWQKIVIIASEEKNLHSRRTLSFARVLLVICVSINCVPSELQMKTHFVKNYI
jgi:hypothetical protein